jgi:hypothetical protein
MLTSLVIFDPSERVAEEGPDGHMLYAYYAEKNFASLMQGVVDFTNFWKTDKREFYTIRTEMHVILLREVEDSIILGMVFPGSVETSKKFFSKFHETYILLHGTIRHQIEHIYPLQDTMDDFIPAFIAAEMGGIPRTTGIRYAPVERHAFLAVHALGMELVDEYEPVEEFAILFAGHLVSTSLDPVAFRPLFEYLVETTAGVSNRKLASPPYGRIATPAVLPGGGSSSFGRTNQIGEKGFLFGADDSGNVFCPLVYIHSEGLQRPFYLCAYLLDELMFVFLLNSDSKPAASLFQKLSHQVSSNLDIHRELVPLLRSDLKHSQADDSAVPFGFAYRNPMNAAVMSKDSAKSEGKSRFGFGGWGKQAATVDHAREALKQRMHALAESDDEIVEISVKSGTNQGWIHFEKGCTGRELMVDMHNDPKNPLWKALEEIDTFTSNKFSTVFLYFRRLMGLYSNTRTAISDRLTTACF